MIMDNDNIMCINIRSYRYVGLKRYIVMYKKTISTCSNIHLSNDEYTCKVSIIATARLWLWSEIKSIKFLR